MLILFHPRYPDKNIKAKLITNTRRLICLGILIAFIFNDIDMAVAGDLLRKDSSSTLRPTNRFDPIAATQEEKDALARGFRETTEFLYVNKAICRAVAMNFTDADELIEWIRDDLKGRRFNEFDYTQIYRNGDSFYLPVKSGDSASTILMRYFRLKGDETSPYLIKLPWRGVVSVGLEFLDSASGDPVLPAIPKAPVDIEESRAADAYTPITQAENHSGDAAYNIIESESNVGEHTVYFKAVAKDGGVISRVSITIDDDCAWVEDASTVKAYRRQGLGTSLIERAFEYALSAAKVLVYCEADNAVGEFWQRHCG